MLSTSQGAQEKTNLGPGAAVRRHQWYDEEEGIWLDKLPHDLLVKVAKFVQLQQREVSRLNDLLSLGEASSRQKDAVLSSMTYSFPENARSTEAVRRWAALFKEAVRNLTAFDTYLSDQAERRSIYAPLLTSSSLEKAVIDGNEVFLSATSQTASLGELRIHVVRNTKQALLDCLASTKASSVSLICSSGFDSTCRFEEIRRELPRLSARFRRFRLFCSCLRSGTTPLWDLLRHMHTLTAVECFQVPPDDVYQLLRGLESVRIEFRDGDGQVVDRLGQIVTGLHLSGHTKASCISSLASCTRLSELCITLLAGEDYAFQGPAAGLHSLEEFSIEWTTIGSSEIDAIPGRLYDYLQDAVSTPGVTRALVEMTSKLSSLSLLRVRIELSELLAILMHCGVHLKVFETSLSGQTETEWTRLCALLDGIAKCNPNMQDFGIEELSDLQTELPPCFSSDGTDPKVLKIEGEKLSGQLKYLQRCVPCLPLADMRAFVDNLIRLGEKAGS